MVKLKIITNNPKVCQKYPGAVFCDAGAREVLISARDLVHLGAVIYTHPLSGNILPGVSPYKSLIISEDDSKTDSSIDPISLNLIENALAAVKDPPVGFAGYDEKTLGDFRVLDFDLLDSAMEKRNGLQYV